MGRRYVQRQDGEWFRVNRRGHFIACCDCGLVHLLTAKLKGPRKHLHLRAWRDERKTAARRRGMKT